jgi:hypothetical protein
MADLLERAYDTATPDLKTRNCVACLQTATAIMNEASTTPGNAERRALAAQVFTTSALQSQVVAMLLGAVLSAAADPLALRPVSDGGTATTSAIADTNLLSSLSAIWNAVAGVQP